MLVKKYKSIMEREAAYRKKWALTMTFSLFAFVFVSFGFYKGFLNIDASNGLVQKNAESQVANVISAEIVPSPIDNSKKTFEAAFVEIGKQYSEVKKTIADVIVPFFTSIEVYER